MSLEAMETDLPIKYFNRYSGTICTERIYGDRWLRWVYGNPLGRIGLWAFFRRSLFSRWYGWRMSSASSRSRIDPFIRTFSVDPDEFLEPVSAYDSFNAFFMRRLKPEARPIASDVNETIFPADGRHMGFSDVSALNAVYAKGQSFKLARLFGSTEKASPYENGSVVISRLCPVDYHRFHFTVEGKASAPTLINGCLQSVNPIALRRNLSILWENKRYLSFVESEVFGRVASLEIGATCVGSVQYQQTSLYDVGKGDEKGWFSFGGSMTMTFFEKDAVRLASDLLTHSAEGREIYARMGDVMACSP